MRKLFYSLSFTLFLFISPALASANTCGETNSGGYAISWCLELGSPQSNHLVYYFHGIGGDEHNWERSKLHTAVGKRLERTPELRPHVLSISFGRAWFFTDTLLNRKDTRLNAFIQLIPTFEAMLPSMPMRRTAAGESMGGYNALRLTMERPGFFQQVVALCPALLTVGPYSTPEEIEAFKQRNREYLDVPRMEALRWWAKREYPNQESWTRNNPLDRAAIPGLIFPPIYISQYLRDAYGFPEGTTLFEQRLRTQDILVQSRIVDAGHCKHSPEVLSEASNAMLDGM